MKKSVLKKSPRTNITTDPITKSDIDQLREAYFFDIQGKTIVSSITFFSFLAFLSIPLTDSVKKYYPNMNTPDLFATYNLLAFTTTVCIFYLGKFYYLMKPKQLDHLVGSLDIVSKQSITQKSQFLNDKTAKLRLLFCFSAALLTVFFAMNNQFIRSELDALLTFTLITATCAFSIISMLFAKLYKDECVISWNDVLDQQKGFLSLLIPNVNIEENSSTQNQRQPKFTLRSDDAKSFNSFIRFATDIAPNCQWTLRPLKRGSQLEIDLTHSLLKESEIQRISNAIKLYDSTRHFRKNNHSNFLHSEKLLGELSKNLILWHHGDLTANEMKELKPTFISSLLPEACASELLTLFKDIIQAPATITLVNFPYGSKLQITGFITEPNITAMTNHKEKLDAIYKEKVVNPSPASPLLKKTENNIAARRDTNKAKQTWSNMPWVKPLSYIPSLFGSRSNVSLAPITTVDENWHQRLLDHGVVDLPLRNANGTQTAWIRIHQPTLDLLNDDSKLIKMLDDYVHGDRDVITALRASDENKYGGASFKIKKWIDPSSSDVRAVFVEAKNIVGDDHLPIYELGIKEKHENAAIKIVRSKNSSLRY